MTRTPLRSFLPFTLACLPLGAQDAPPGPAPELAKLKPLAGHWSGSGTATMQPGAPPVKWTAQMTSEWVLGGHWLQTDTSVVFETGEKMRLREYAGWDRENQRYVNVAVNNMGEVTMTTPHFTADDTLVVMGTTLRQGSPEAERAVTKFAADEQTFTITFLGPQGPSADGVHGKLQRVDKAEPQPLEAAAAIMPADAAMTRLARMAGRFAVAGEMILAPGQPAMKITGVDDARTLFDGSIVQIVTTGTAEGMPGSYEAHGYYAWNPADQCYRTVMVSNTGEVMEGQTRFAGDDKVIQTWAGVRMGQPYVARTVVDLDANGKPARAVNHSCVGTAAPMQDFSCTYKTVSAK